MTHNFKDGTRLLLKDGRTVTVGTLPFSVLHRHSWTHGAVNAIDREGYAVLVYPDEIQKVLALASGLFSSKLVEDLLGLAIKHEIEVEFLYTDAQGKTELRHVEPYDIHEGGRGQKLLTGWDKNRDDEYRAFRLDRITGIPALVVD